MLTSKNTKIIIIVIASILLSESILYIMAYLNDRVVGDFGGYLYVRFVVPLVTLLVVIILVRIGPKSMPELKRIAIILSIIIAISLVMHQVALNSGNISGYRLPSHFNTQEKSLDELAALLPNQNDEITNAVLDELGARGNASNDVLVSIIDRLRKTSPGLYYDFYETRMAAELLAKRNDSRVIPVLNDMLKSNHYNVASYRNARERVYTTRIQAKELLEKYFKVKVNVETKQVIKNNS